MREPTIINRGRGPELAGTRITVYDVFPYFKAGDSPEFIADAMSLSTPEVELLIKYIEDHREEVEAEDQKTEDRIARGNPPEIMAKVAQSRTHQLIEARWQEIQRRRSQEGNGESDPA